MTIPANIPETPMADAKHESYQESKENSSMEVFHHIINKVMDIQNEKIFYPSKIECHTEVLKLC